jgi:hypothetical protein
MRFIWPVLLMIPGVAQAQLHPAIAQCARIEEDFGRDMWKLRQLLDQNASDRGGQVDPGLTMDVNFALVDVKQFVHTQIQLVQRAADRGGQPSAKACETVRAVAGSKIGPYVRYLLDEVNPLNFRQRGAARAQLREELRLAGHELGFRTNPPGSGGGER